MLAGAAKGEKGSGIGGSRVRLSDVDTGRLAGLMPFQTSGGSGQ